LKPFAVHIEGGLAEGYRVEADGHPYVAEMLGNKLLVALGPNSDPYDPSSYSDAHIRVISERGEVVLETATPIPILPDESIRPAESYVISNAADQMDISHECTVHITHADTHETRVFAASDRWNVDNMADGVRALSSALPTVSRLHCAMPIRRAALCLPGIL
jgi:hypothetical protein